MTIKGFPGGAATDGENFFWGVGLEVYREVEKEEEECEGGCESEGGHGLVLTSEESCEGLILKECSESVNDLDQSK